MPPKYLKRISKLIGKNTPFEQFIRELTGFKVVDTELYELAFTHKSASVYYGKNFSVNNERLEFLGDSILDAVISEFLFDKYINENEGFLSTLKSRIVNRHTLNHIAEKTGLNRYIKVKIDSAGIPPSVLGNAMEAFIGAVFLEKGYSNVRKLIINKLIIPNIDIDKLVIQDTNYKGQIIDWAQKKHKTLEFDCHEANSKTSHTFNVTLYIDNVETGRGAAESKKEAEQRAAENALKKIGLIKSG